MRNRGLIGYQYLAPKVDLASIGVPLDFWETQNSVGQRFQLGMDESMLQDNMGTGDLLNSCEQVILFIFCSLFAQDNAKPNEISFLTVGPAHAKR